MTVNMERQKRGKGADVHPSVGDTRPQPTRRPAAGTPRERKTGKFVEVKDYQDALSG